MLFPFLVAALFFVVERIAILWQRWRRRRQPDSHELPALQALRAEVAEKGWAAL